MLWNSRPSGRVMVWAPTTLGESRAARKPVGAVMIAALPMYDFPELRADNDALWAALAENLTATHVASAINAE